MIPRPEHVAWGNGQFVLRPDDAVRADGSDPAVLEAAAWCLDQIRAGAGRDLLLSVPGDPRARIAFVERTGLTGEAYRLVVQAQAIRLEAGTRAGFIHGAATLAQWITATRGELPAATVEDAPRFRWRGVMLDSARHFQSVAFIKGFIDRLAYFKFNTLHWHLTDDQAWRLEIKAYPRLTRVGAWRVPAGVARRDIDPETGVARRYGGFYTQEEVREVVAYASARAITIIPEIEMPGHISAALVAYPEIGATPDRVAAVPADWGIYPNLIDVGPAGRAFAKNVLTEVMALFPGRFIHVGGDEVDPHAWLNSEPARLRLSALKTSDPLALEGDFLSEIGAFLAAHGRRMVGWDEIEGPGLPEEAVVMSWHGADAAARALGAGRDTVLAPSPEYYFDNRQSDAADEPPGRAELVTLERLYRTDPVPAGYSSSDHLLGVEGAVWTEHVRTEPRVLSMVFPRAAALAETAWSPASAHDWPDFAARLARLAPYLTGPRFGASDSAFAPRIEPSFEAHRIRVRITSQLGGVVPLSYRYTVDGTEPGADSPVLDQRASGGRDAGLELESGSAPQELVLQTMLDGVSVGQARRWSLDPAHAQRRDSHELALCTDKLALALEDDAPLTGPRAVFLVDIEDPCWIDRHVVLVPGMQLKATVGQIPFNFQIGADRDAIRFEQPETPAGELVVHLDGCEGREIARIPLDSAQANDGLSLLPGADLGQNEGVHDLCLRFAQHSVDPLWVLHTVDLTSPR